MAKTARKVKTTTDSKHNLPVLDNLLQQDFLATEPNQKWAGDITYLWTDVVLFMDRKLLRLKNQ